LGFKVVGEGYGDPKAVHETKLLEFLASSNSKETGVSLFRYEFPSNFVAIADGW